jgi:hypothetical protein
LTATGPALSVVLVTDRAATIRYALAHLRAQELHDRIELVLVTDRESDLDPGAVDGFWDTQVLHVDGAAVRLSRGRAEGTRAARAPVVAFGESHAIPQPGWAEALLRAHEEPWAAVAPRIENANPGSMMSWTNLYLDYGPWTGWSEAVELRDLPGHNSSYKRDVLLELDDRLEELLEAETMLHEELRARGHRLRLEPAARLRHVNILRWRELAHERFNNGRRFGAARARRFSWPRRVVYAVGSPLIPAIRIPRIVRDLERAGQRKELLRGMAPSLLLAVSVSAAGELVGYLAGAGRSAENLSRIELHKQEDLPPEEREPPGPAHE